jgi:hypothetical protein
MSSANDVRHAEQRVITNADQVELKAIIDSFAVIGEGIYDDKIAGVLDDLDVGGAVQDLEPEEAPEAEPAGDGQELWSRQNVVLDDEAGAILDELKRRSELMAAAYPFTITGNTVTYRPSKSLIYEYCLGICLAPTITRKPFVKLPRSFERVSAILVQAWLGPDADSFHVGAPRYRTSAKSFAKVIELLSAKCSKGREWRYHPQPDFIPQIPRVGDEGLDFVAWRRSPDGRPGNLYIAGQCACGDDWDSKFHDLTKKRLQSWINPLTYLPVLRAFTTPYILSEGNLIVAQRDAGWTLDRIRLSLIAEANKRQPLIKTLIPYIKQMFDLSQRAA